MLLDQVEERRERNLLSRQGGVAGGLRQGRRPAQEERGPGRRPIRPSSSRPRADYEINIDNAKAEVAKAEAAVEDARVNLGYCRMYAPIAGRIGELKVKVGNLVGDGRRDRAGHDPAARPDGARLPPARPVSARRHRAAAQGAAGQADRRGRTGSHPHVGKAIFIDNNVDSTTSTFLMRAEVAEPRRLAACPASTSGPSMTVGEYVDAVVVPEQAVVEGQEGSRVFVVDAPEQGRRSPRSSRSTHYQRPARARVGPRARPEGDRRGHPARPARARSSSRSRPRSRSTSARSTGTGDPRSSRFLSPRSPACPGSSPTAKQERPAPKRADPKTAPGRPPKAATGAEPAARRSPKPETKGEVRPPWSISSSGGRSSRPCWPCSCC